MPQCRLFTIATASASFLAATALAAEPLPSFNVDRMQASVSGLSSGAFMAVQFHTAYSADVMGAGVVAGGPYNCAYVNFGGIDACMQGTPRGEASYAGALSLARLGKIDNTDNLRRARVYSFSGTRDAVVAQSVVDATYGYYQAVGVPKSRIQYVRTVPAGHDAQGGVLDGAGPTGRRHSLGQLGLLAPLGSTWNGAYGVYRRRAMKPQEVVGCSSAALARKSSRP